VGVKRDCGKFRLSLAISAGIHRASRKDLHPDPKLVKRAHKALAKLREKYEEKMMEEWGKAIGWGKEAAEEAAAAAKADRQALLDADTAGREEKQERRRVARV
jgi:hypothetical protein